MAARNLLALCLVAVMSGGMAAWQLGWLAPRLGRAETEVETSSSPTGPVPRPTRACPAIAEGIDRKALKAHLEAFEDIARKHEGNRATNTEGYDASVDYVVERLEAAGLEVTLSRFNVPDFDVLGPGALEIIAPEARVFRAARKYRQPARTPGAAYTVLVNTPPGDVRGALVAVDLALGRGNKATSGCEKEDFPGSVRGKVVLMQRGTCPFATKVRNAELAGAKAAIIFNQGDTRKRRGLVPGQLIGKPSEQDIAIPVLFARTSTGETLARMLEKGPVEARVYAQTRWRLEPALNVLTELPGTGDKADEVVMLGAHLDSVEKGPGINDNASGSAALLAIAAQLAGCRSARTLRIAWWGAEELGLIGSTSYVDLLDDEAKAKIRAYINLDMIGSVNHVYLLGRRRRQQIQEGRPGHLRRARGVLRRGFCRSRAESL